MPIVCALGLAACLTFGQEKIPAEDAVGIMDHCDLARQLSVTDFDGMTGFGVVVGESLEKSGLKFVWGKGGYLRKRNILTACRIFSIAFYNNAMWENLEKWPY